MIDIHHHCLPGVDDGPRDWPDAVAMCRIAAEEGIEVVVATPHVFRGLWKNVERGELERRLRDLQEQVGSRPRLLLGSEYFFAHDMAEVLRDQRGIIPLADTRYVLVEFAAHTIPPLIDQTFYKLQLDGWSPIIAHPERNRVFQAKPELLVSLIELGARTQVTAASLTGQFGATAAASARAWLKGGLVHIIATDAHDPVRRPPRVSEALHIAAEIAGNDVVRAVTVDNPAAIVAGQRLPFEPEPELRHAGGFFRNFVKLFRGRSERSH